MEYSPLIYNALQSYSFVITLLVDIKSKVSVNCSVMMFLLPDLRVNYLDAVRLITDKE